MSLKWLGVIPWVIMLGGMPFFNHVEPFVLGLPLPLAFATGCTLLSAVILFLVYWLDPANTAGTDTHAADTYATDTHVMDTQA